LLALHIVAPTISLILKLFNLDSFHFGLMFIYFHSVSGLLRSCCRWPE